VSARARERRRLAAELLAAGRGWLVGAVTFTEWAERSDLLLALFRKEA
jgi:hypothetical protein